MKQQLDALKASLIDLLLRYSDGGALCIAFSGGVDSALLVKLSCSAGIPVHAVTFQSTLQPAREAQEAAAQAASYGARHLLLRVDPLEDPAVRQNTRDRCYRCKYALFASLREYAQKEGCRHVIDGTNADDLREFRPGLRALEELGIHSPLRELNISKAQVRALADEIGLDVAQKPSSPCLATRFPYDTLLTPAELMRAGRAEAVMHKAGFPAVRVRIHGELARIEVPTDRLCDLCAVAGKIQTQLKELGYRFVTMDLSGFHSGSFDN